jgi:phosphoketolase
LQEAISNFDAHRTSGRVKERDHALAHRSVGVRAPRLEYKPVPSDRLNLQDWMINSPMSAIDATFLEFVKANPQLRPRVGNPDEMESNRMRETLKALKFRVTDPECGRPEDVHGAIISALNEEAIAAAATGNKGGINLIVTYEAFGTKMHGLMRQEITFANGLALAGSPPRWASVPLVLTSQTWENAKNEFSHQDPSMTEAMLGEAAQVSRVIFPVDFNTAAVALADCYATHGQIWTMVVPKGKLPDLFSQAEAQRLMNDGAAFLDWLSYKDSDAGLALVAVGGYQLHEITRASLRLRERDIPHRVIYVIEPGRLRAPRSRREAAHVLSNDEVRTLFPDHARARVLLTHTRPEVIVGMMSRIHTGPQTIGLGFRNDGGTLDVGGMLWVNGCSWAHCLRAAASTSGIDEAKVLTAEERSALDGEQAPDQIISWLPDE